jgi:DNA-binding NtrC family response regulator
MDKSITILVADRNRNVREFLKREMTADGYRILLAKSAQEVLNGVYDHQDVDLLILDPDLPGYEKDLIEKIEDRIPTIPIVIHTFLSDDASYPTDLGQAAFVEKRGNSVERLKSVIVELLMGPAPGGKEKKG